MLSARTGRARGPGRPRSFGDNRIVPFHLEIVRIGVSISNPLVVLTQAIPAPLSWSSILDQPPGRAVCLDHVSPDLVQDRSSSQPAAWRKPYGGVDFKTLVRKGDAGNFSEFPRFTSSVSFPISTSDP